MKTELRVAKFLVVDADELSEARAVARMFRSIGIMREAFSSDAEAAQWNREQERLSEAEQRRLRARSGPG